MRLPLCFLLKASAQLLCWDSGSHADNNQAVRKTACARAETLLLQKLLPSHHPPPHKTRSSPLSLKGWTTIKTTPGGSMSIPEAVQEDRGSGGTWTDTHSFARSLADR